MKKTVIHLLLIVPILATAQNPIIRDQFTADPTARVFKNKVYLYPSHDIKPPDGQRQDWFCMEDYHVFSSENLTDWTDHGVILTHNKVPWVKPDSYSMWAPDCVERNGKYYFYFSSPQKDGSGFNIGVAIAERPEGPFVPEPESIKGISGIDPCVLLASDGNAYLFWGAGRCARLKPNMKEIVDDTPTERVKWGDREFELKGISCLKGLPNRQAEGPFAFEYNGNYYLAYSYVRDKSEVLGYAMSKNPMGPYEYKGIIMAEHPNGCWTNHHSIINYKGQWYLFYHTNFFSPNDDKRRSVCIEKLYFNSDGTIQEVKETMRGVGVNKATELIQVDRYSTAAANVTSEEIDAARAFSGRCATMPVKGSWIKYDDVDFSGVTNGFILINVKAFDNTEFCVREGSTKGKVLARFKLSFGTENRYQRNQWMTQTAPLEYIPKGVTNLVVTNEGNGALSVDNVQFKPNVRLIPPKKEIVPDNNSLSLSTTFAIRNFVMVINDISARVHEVKDSNNEPCALIKLQTNDDLVSVEGNLVRIEKQDSMEKWIYVTEGTKQVKLFFKRHLPVSLSVADYGMEELKGGTTYVLKIE